MTLWNDYEPRYRALLERELASAEDVERLLLERSELDAEVQDASARAYVAMTCRTDDEEAKDAYLRVTRELEPPAREARFQLDRKVVESPFGRELDPERYGVLLREARADVGLFHEANPALEAECNALFQSWGEIQGAMTVEHPTDPGRGTLTMQQADALLESPDRELRRATWERMAARRAAEYERIDELFDRQVALRTEIAGNAGFASYRDYAFVEKHRFDYTPEDCLAFHDAIERHFGPLGAELRARRARKLELATLRPWDQQADPDGRKALHPFETTEELVAGVSRIFHDLDPELGERFDSLRGGESLDLESRPGKAPGGYQVTFEVERRPFVFMNATGRNDDLRTLTHETGHAFHTLYAAHEPLLPYRQAGAEFSEVASMSMELLTHPRWVEFYDEDDARRARRDHLEVVVRTFSWVAVIDAFQHWVYTHPGHTAEARAGEWAALYRRFTPGLDWSGAEEALQHDWQRVPHFFSHPFYFIEYGIAQLGALQLWRKAKEDPADALAGYKRALALGGSRPLPELFAAAGLELDLDGRTMEAVAALLRDELAALD